MRQQVLLLVLLVLPLVAANQREHQEEELNDIGFSSPTQYPSVRERVLSALDTFANEGDSKRSVASSDSFVHDLEYLKAHENDTFVHISLEHTYVESEDDLSTRIDERGDSITIEEPIIIPWGSVQDSGPSGSTYRARRYVILNLEKDESNFLFYPYEFESEAMWNNTPTTKDFTDGAFLDTEAPENLPAPDDYYFYYLNSTSVDLSRAKAVYDSSIAVLQVTDNWIDNVPIDLTFEADYFCTMFYNYIWGKYVKCFRGTDEWDAYLNDFVTYPKHEPVSIVFVSPENITAGKLKSTNGQNRFGMLIIPDIVEGSHDVISGRLGAAGATRIREFVQAGGSLYTSGKGAIVAELLNLVNTGTFDKQYTITSTASTLALATGCLPTDFTESGDSEFVHRTLCFSPVKGDTWVYNSLLSGPRVIQGDSSYTTYASWKTDVSWRPIVLHDTATGLNSDLPNAGVAGMYPMIMYKRYGIGHIVLNLGNSPFDWNSFPFVYNAFILANSKSLVLNNYIQGGIDRVIPALETVTLQVKLELKNIYTVDLTAGATVTVWGRRGVTVTTSDCVVVTTNVPTPPISDFDVTKSFDCSIASMPQLSSKSWNFKLDIVNNTITQEKVDIALLYPQVVYTDGSKTETIGHAVTVDSAMAALLRADMNIDPSSMYPLHARGSYVDNVMNCENKEETPATDVSHVSIVPLISPLIDINDQIALAHYVEFDAAYYTQTVNHIDNYVFPFDSNDAFDYMDFTLLYNRGNMLAASWDEAVKIFRTARDTVTGAGDSAGVDISTILNANYQTNNENDFFLLKQHNFVNSDSYYEHATQRMMAFLDTWEPKAAATFYGGTIPVDARSASNSLVSKFKLLFVRHDIFFWTKYALPTGLPDHNNVITMDRYPQTLSTPCKGAGPQSSTSTVAGVFTSTNPKGLIPVQWQNELLLDCNRVKVDPANVKTKSGGAARLTHYVVPITDPNIKSAGDLNDFTGNTLNQYPEVKYVTMYQATIDVDPASSRKGGEMVIYFSSDIWAGASFDTNEYVTVAADQIAVFKIWYTAQQLHIRFKRGNMPNEAYGQPSHLQVNLEGTNIAADTITVSMDTYSLVYDIADAADNYERWYDVKSVSGQSVKFQKLGALSLPALRLEFTLQDDTNQDSIMQPYEFLEPFVRYGLYEQELLYHRAVHGSAEIHPINEPCLVTRNGGFSTFTHVGTSSVPFREYVNTGISLVIPAAPETGRVEWTDMWGRHWAQPVRSTIFEYPPIPPPLRNFVMTTTFEILSKSGGTPLLDWRSDDAVDIHVQLKLLNNYPKWFEITTCKANEVVQLCTDGYNCGHSRLFDTDFYPSPDFMVPTDKANNKQYIKIGHNASYGICFRDAEVYLSGEHLTADERELIQHAAHCAQIIDDEDPVCEQLGGLPTVSRRPSGNTANPYNFAQQVLDYWPQDYIMDIMWDMTHYDYDDTKFDKAYKYHMDNNLPHLGHWIPKTDNIIAFPLFKGLGYQMQYDASYSNPKFSGKRGWWSDNLQNRDRTLVAGQATSNKISVGKSSLIPNSQWTDITTLVDASAEAATALKNIYTCLFNRKWLMVAPNNEHTHYLTNVYENNVIPLPPYAVQSYYTDWDCNSSAAQYTPDNIGQYPNVVYTDSPRDWLYFASNLRGNALENINILYHLTPLDEEKLKFEGIAKVQDGGRFVYWNPANSRNSFLVVDNAVSTVMAIRNDIELQLEVIPTYATTFDATLFQHIMITDIEEDHREWTNPIYIKHHGYGDFVVSVYVGGDGGSAILNPGGYARVKYTYSNNAGFDINLKATAIESSEIEEQAINSNDLMFNLVHTLKYPDKYNFMNVEVPDELAPYITIKPCKDVVGIAPLFFDFDNINVATIRDGWKGDYYYDFNLATNFPSELRGRMYTLPVTLNKTYFEYFPGKGDPTGIHENNYEVELPPIVFGVPYGSDNNLYAGKVFYTSGYATDVHFQHLIPTFLEPEKAYFVTLDMLDELTMCLSGAGEYTCMDNFWNSLATNDEAVECEFQKTMYSPTIVSVDYAPGFNAYAPTFPKKMPPTAGPDVAELHLLVKLTAAQLAAGYPVVSYQDGTTFKDHFGTSKSWYDYMDYDVHSKGAWLSAGYNGVLCSDSGLPLATQILKPADAGFVDVTVTIRNSGDGMAYNVNMSLIVPKNVTIVETSISELEYTIKEVASFKEIKDGAWVLTIFMNVPLSPGSSQAYKVMFQFPADERDGAGANAAAPLNQHIMCYAATGAIDLTPTAGEKTVSQVIDSRFSILYSDKPKPAYYAFLGGQKDNGHTATLHVDYDPDVVQDVRNLLWRFRAPDTEWSTFAFGADMLDQEVDINELWANLSDSSSYSKPTIDFMVSLTRSAYVSATAMPVILCETNVWQWHESTGNMLWLLLLIPGVLVPFIALLFCFVKYPGRQPKDEPLLAAEEAAPYTSSSSTSSSSVAEEKSSEKPKKAKKAKRWMPGGGGGSAEPEPEPTADTGSAGPTYLIAGVHPVNVVDSRNT